MALRSAGKAYYKYMAILENEVTVLPISPSKETPTNGEKPKDNPAQEQPRAAAAVKPARLVSLDAFRGLTIVLMLLVNNIALDIFTPKHLTHAAWNAGLNLADLVAPWFLFCVGIAIPFSAASFAKTGKPAWKHDLKIVRRGALLIGLGCLIDSSLYNGPIFCLDVLQLIGLAYMVGALFYDLPMSRRIGIAGALLVGYWAVIKYIPIPGIGSGHFEQTTNFIAHLNRTYLMPFNLTGLPSIVPTSALVLIGTAIGDLLRRRDRDPMWVVAWLMLTGVVLTIVGIIWNASLAYNKPLWTPSYILFAAGTGSIVLGLLYLVIDAHKLSKWAYPLVIFGSNAIVAYVAPILTKLWILQRWHVNIDGHGVPVLQRLMDLCKLHFGPVPGGWIYTIGYIAVWWLILQQLYRKKLFLRV